MGTMDITNDEYWDERYTSRVGSGIGSMGALGKLKANYVKATIEKYDIKSVLDVGCGDLQWIKKVEIENYVGIDFSNEVVVANRKLKPDWKFKVQNVSEQPIKETAELVICLDVLLHQSNRMKYDFLLDNLMAATEKVILVSGFKDVPEKHGETLFFYETIYDALDRLHIPFEYGFTCRESDILEGIM